MLRSIDELKARAGSHLGYSEWREITQERVNRFADDTDDHQWIHVDVERAKSRPFGQTIAHGFLTLSLAVPMLEEVFDVEGTKLIVNYGLNRVRFPAPMPVGSRIRLGAVLKVPRMSPVVSRPSSKARLNSKAEPSHPALPRFSTGYYR